MRITGDYYHYPGMSCFPAVMSSCEELSAVDCSGLGEEHCDYSRSITRRAQLLKRQLKAIENVRKSPPRGSSLLVQLN